MLANITQFNTSAQLQPRFLIMVSFQLIMSCCNFGETCQNYSVWSFYIFWIFFLFCFTRQKLVWLVSVVEIRRNHVTFKRSRQSVFRLQQRIEEGVFYFVLPGTFPWHCLSMRSTALFWIVESQTLSLNSLGFRVKTRGGSVLLMYISTCVPVPLGASPVNLPGFILISPAAMVTPGKKSPGINWCFCC